MKISREFAKVLVEILEGRSSYDPDVAADQLRSAIRDEILYSKIKAENSSLAPFMERGVSEAGVMKKVKIATKKALDESYL